jgi:hypothetical protein
LTRRARITRGRYATTLRLPSRSWSNARITARFTGDAQHRSASATRVVRRP